MTFNLVFPNMINWWNQIRQILFHSIFLLYMLFTTYSDSNIATSHLYSVCANKQRYASCRTIKGVGLIIALYTQRVSITCYAYLLDCL